MPAPSKPASGRESRPAASAYRRACEYVADAVWAIHPSALATIKEILAERSSGERPTLDEIRERIGADEKPEPRPAPGVAVIEISGPIFPKANLMTEVSGATSVATLRSAFREAMADDDVHSIVLDVDSPGGSVDQIPEIAAEIFAARGRKPIVAVANTMAASAAYWIASAADQLVVTPSGEVGSIGVYSVHDDVSAAQEKAGVKTTLVSAGEYKTEGNPFEPLGDEARAEMQRKVDAYLDMFVDGVASGRGVSPEVVRDSFGKGRMFMPVDAVSLGMADRVGTLDDTLSKLATTNRPESRSEVRQVAAFPLEGVSIRESRSGDGTLHLAGHAAVFDRLSHDLGGFREKIAKGAFSSVLDEDPDVHLVIGHDMNRVLARTRSKTLELREDPAGLRVWARLDPDDPDVKALVPKMRRGDMDQMSFAFTVARGGDSWLIEGEEDDERVIRTVNEVSGLFDVSVVAQGAYPQTDANLRGLLEAAIESGRLVREAMSDDQQDAEPDGPAGESEPQGEPLASDEKRTTAEAEPPAGDSSRDDAGETTRAHNEELANLKALTRTETQLSKRRLLAAQDDGGK